MKKRYMFIWLLVCLLVFALIPANLFLFFFPEWVSAIGIVAILASCILFYCKGKGHKCSKIVITFMTMIFCGFTWFATYCNPFWNSILLKKSYPVTNSCDSTLSYTQAKEDLNCVRHYLEKVHPLFKFGLSDEMKEAFESADENLKKADAITVNFLEQQIQKVLSKLRDAHTNCYSLYDNKHYLRTIQEKKDTGYFLAQINHVPLQTLVEQKSELLSYEVISWAAESMYNRLSSLEGLKFLEFDIENGITFTWENDNGETVDETYYPEDFVTEEEYNKIYPERDKGRQEYFYYTLDKEHDLAILTVRKCRFNDEYVQCVKEMFTQVKELGITNVAVDLRDNGGGSSIVAEEFLRYLDLDSYKVGTELWRFGPFEIYDKFNNKGILQNNKYEDLLYHGKVYALTSADSFSSAMLFAAYIKDNHLGTLIGEPPANAVTGFGEVAEFYTKNSKLVFQISSKTFTRADKETTDILVTPDIPCDAEDAMTILYEQICD